MSGFKAGVREVYELAFFFCLPLGTMMVLVSNCHD